MRAPCHLLLHLMLVGSPVLLPHELKSQEVQTGSVVIRNVRADSVTVEVQMVEAADSCGAGVSLGVRTILPGRYWAISSLGSLCVRWVVERNRGQEWSAWLRREPLISTRQEVEP
jgi:hypothetical protein